LQRSLGFLKIAAPIGMDALKVVLAEVIRRNRVQNGFLYMQISRGVAPRDHAFPARLSATSLVVTAKAHDPAPRNARFRDGVAVVTRPDERWAHPHIKSLQLLPNVLAKQAAREQGAYECWFVDKQGYVTEGASTNAWIVIDEATLVTRQADDAILRGITRGTLFDAVAGLGLKIEERPFSREEAYRAREAFFSSATTIATPVVKIDGHQIGSGRPGPIATKLAAVFHQFAK
jgi:D-alanine transaminase